MTGPTVRRAHPDDAEAIGEVHVSAWQAAYRGQMPDEYLDRLRPSESAAWWRQGLTAGGGDGACDLDGQRGVVLVLEDGGAVVGISSFGPAREPVEPGPGELFMINLSPHAWGRGLGRVLLGAVTDELRSQDYPQAILWVLDTNVRARRFYEAAGWTTSGVEKLDERPGFVLRELRYDRRLG